MDRDDDRHAREGDDVVRRVEEVEVGAVGGAADGDELAQRVMRRVDRDERDAVGQGRAGGREGDQLVLARRSERAEETVDVRADAVVGDLARVDADPHRPASSRSRVIVTALASQR